MSRENVEVVRAVYERWSEGDFRAAVELFDPYVVLVLRPESVLSPPTSRRISALRKSQHTHGTC